MSERGVHESVEDIEVRLLLEALFVRYHFDFRGYAMVSMKRRLRTALERLGCASISELQERVLRDSRMFDRLLQIMTVQVSEMFRDPSYYRTFREKIVPDLRTYPSLKLWIAGCAGGEEVYSFAIVLEEEGLLARTLVYATDINPEGLARAKQGVYPLDRAKAYSAAYAAAGGTRSLSDYYTAAYDGIAMASGLREHVVFSDHSLATDSVFAEVNVVSCRNVLIYFDRPLQTRALGLFHEALARRGYLGLGARESLKFTPYDDKFTPVDAGDRWYRRL